jgi:hypothetical protein
LSTLPATATSFQNNPFFIADVISNVTGGGLDIRSGAPTLSVGTTGARTLPFADGARYFYWNPTADSGRGQWVVRDRDHRLQTDRTDSLAVVEFVNQRPMITALIVFDRGEMEVNIDEVVFIRDQNGSTVIGTVNHHTVRAYGMNGSEWSPFRIPILGEEGRDAAVAYQRQFHLIRSVDADGRHDLDRVDNRTHENVGFLVDLAATRSTLIGERYLVDFVGGAAVNIHSTRTRVVDLRVEPDNNDFIGSAAALHTWISAANYGTAARPAVHLSLMYDIRQGSLVHVVFIQNALVP